jgi:hypothetical protein
MGNIPLTPQGNVSTDYRPVYASVARAYMQQLQQYNQRFRNIARIGANNQVELTEPIQQLFYNPPQPVWIQERKVDPYFATDIATYNAQIQKSDQFIKDLRMVEVLNTPPVPRPPPESILLPDPQPQFVGNAANYLPAPGTEPGTTLTPAPGADPGSTLTAAQAATAAALRATPGYDNYRLLFLSGTKYIPQPIDSAKAVGYNTIVRFDPPIAGEKYKQILDRYVRLYDQIRQYQAGIRGSEVFDLPFIAPNYTASGVEAFQGNASRREGFVDPPVTAPTTTNLNRCLNVNTTQENWYLNQIIDLQGKFDVQRNLCKTKGFDYDPTKCGLQSCLMTYSSQNTSDPPEPETSQRYNFNKLSFSASGFPNRLDQTNYAAKLASMESFRVDDIEKYYNFLNDYNFYWVNQDGWRQIDDAKRPYNPPLPPWEDKLFVGKVNSFNESAIQILKRFNNYEQLSLPGDFGALPPIPQYPNALYELLTKPKMFLTPLAASSVGQRIDRAPNTVKYDVPVTQLPILYEAAQKRMASATEAEKPTKPKCNTGGAGQVCVKYDDDISDAAKLILKEMEGRKSRLQRERDSAAAAAAANSATNPVVQAESQELLAKLKEDIRATIRSILG